MKKKIGLIIGCVLFVILAVGSVSNGEKDNVKVNSKQTQSSKKASEKQSQQEEKKEYEISGAKTKSDQFATYVTGILQNNGG